MARSTRRATSACVPTPLWRAAGIVAGVYVAFYVFAGIWSQVLNIKEESDLPDELGANHSTAALVAVLVLVVRHGARLRGVPLPRAAVHLAARVDRHAAGRDHHGRGVRIDPRRVVAAGLLVPLAVLGFGLCLIYAWTRSLYPCVALHAVNNAIAFGVTQDWTWQIPLLAIGGTCVSLLIVRAIGQALGNRSAGRVLAT